MASLGCCTNKYSECTRITYTQIILLTDEREEDEEEDEEGPVFQEADFKLDEFIQRCDISRIKLRGVPKPKFCRIPGTIKHL